MKTLLSLTLSVMIAALAAAVASPLSASPRTQKAYAIGVSSVINHAGETVVVPGDSRLRVLQQFGSSYQKLGPDVWLYYRFHAVDGQGERDGCDRLLIVFRESEVSEMRLVNGRAHQVIAARLKADSTSIARVFVRATGQEIAAQR